jgi:hypothetical protein
MRSHIIGAAVLPGACKELQTQTKPPSNSWLLDANDDTERFRRLQLVAGGTDIPMWEVAHRYEELYVAIQNNNWEMGVYHWEKLRDRMNTAAMKRPARTQNLEGMFLNNGVWQSMHDALTSKDAGRMRQQFQAVRQACINCHVAEKLTQRWHFWLLLRTPSFAGWRSARPRSIRPRSRPFE